MRIALQRHTSHSRHSFSLRSPFSQPVSNCSALRQSGSTPQLSPMLSLDRALLWNDVDSCCSGSGSAGTVNTLSARAAPEPCTTQKEWSQARTPCREPVARASSQRWYRGKEDSASSENCSLGKPSSAVSVGLLSGSIFGDGCALFADNGVGWALFADNAVGCALFAEDGWALFAEDGWALFAEDGWTLFAEDGWTLFVDNAVDCALFDRDDCVLFDRDD